MTDIHNFSDLYRHVMQEGSNIYLERHSLKARPQEEVRPKRGIFSRIFQISKAISSRDEDSSYELARRVRELADRDIASLQDKSLEEKYDELEKIFDVLEKMHLFQVEEEMFSDIRLGSLNMEQIRNLKNILMYENPHLELIEKIKTGRVEEALVLISKMSREDLGKAGRGGETALQWASSQGYQEVAKELLAKMRPEDFGKADDDGKTALYWACDQGHQELAKELISKMSPEDLGKADNGGYTVLHGACFRGYQEVAKELIAKMNPEDLGKANDYGQTALHGACFQGYQEVAKELIAKMNPEDLGKADVEGRTALHGACFQGYQEVAKELIAKMNPEDLGKANVGGQTALHEACFQGYQEVAKELIAKMNPEDLGKANDYGQTALHGACFQGYQEVAKELIAKMNPEDLGKADYNGRTALYMACRKGHQEVAKELIAKMNREDLGKADNHGYTEFHYASEDFIESLTSHLTVEQFETVFNLLSADKKEIMIENVTEEQSEGLGDAVKAQFQTILLLKGYETSAGEILKKSAEASLDLSRVNIPNVEYKGNIVDFSNQDSRSQLLNQILKIFDELITPEDLDGVLDDSGNQLFDGNVENTRRSLELVVTNISTQNEKVTAIPSDPEERERQYSMLGKMLGHIILKLENTDTKPEEKKTILFAFANTGKYCFKRYMLEVAQQYNQNVPNETIEKAIEEIHKPELAFEKDFFKELEKLKKQKFEELYQARLAGSGWGDNVHTKSLAVDLMGAELGLPEYGLYGREDEAFRGNAKIGLGLVDYTTGDVLPDDKSKHILMTSFLKNHYRPSFIFEEMTKYLDSIKGKAAPEGENLLQAWLMSQDFETDECLNLLNVQKRDNESIRQYLKNESLMMPREADELDFTLQDDLDKVNTALKGFSIERMLMKEDGVTPKESLEPQDILLILEKAGVLSRKG